MKRLWNRSLGPGQLQLAGAVLAGQGTFPADIAHQTVLLCKFQLMTGKTVLVIFFSSCICSISRELV